MVGVTVSAVVTAGTEDAVEKGLRVIRDKIIDKR